MSAEAGRFGFWRLTIIRSFAKGLRGSLLFIRT